ncbi:ribonucleotide reductase N-terminal alpha domain-containing protein, partial [Pseudomonas aeruginosa]
LEVFMEEARENTVHFNSVAERMEYMKEHDYYYNVLDEYSLEEVEEVYNIAYGENFEFQSYMAASKFYKDYALKTNDQKQYLESYEDRVAIVSLYLGR